MTAKTVSKKKRPCQPNEKKATSRPGFKLPEKKPDFPKVKPRKHGKSASEPSKGGSTDDTSLKALPSSLLNPSSERLSHAAIRQEQLERCAKAVCSTPLNIDESEFESAFNLAITLLNLQSDLIFKMIKEPNMPDDDRKERAYGLSDLSYLVCTELRRCNREGLKIIEAFRDARCPFHLAGLVQMRTAE